MKLKKICFVCFFFTIVLVSFAEESRPQQSKLSQAKDKVVDYLADKMVEKKDKEEIQRLRNELRAKDAEIERLRKNLDSTCEELQRQREAMIALQEIARMLNVRFQGDAGTLFLKRSIMEKLQSTSYLPSSRLTQEQLQSIDDLLADEPVILQIIKKYHNFFRKLEGKKLILIPEY